MRTTKRAMTYLAAMAVPMVLMLMAASPAQAGESISERVAAALQVCFDGDLEKSQAMVAQLLKQDDLSKEDRIGAYAAMSTIQYSMGAEHLGQARAYLEKIRELGPCRDELPSSFWVKPLREQWYTILKDNDALTCQSTESPQVRTIAIMEFDNYSTGKYQEELGFLAKGLSDAFESDFRALDDLKVVERDKIDFVLKEIMMSQEGMVDEATAVKAGKLLGAQIMVFGSIMQLDGKTARMMVKAVKVETSEILATAEEKGKPDFFAMEEDLVKKLADKLDVAISPAAKTVIDTNGSENLDAATLYSKGLYYVDHYEYAKAYDFFKQAYAMDQTYAAAKRKMDIYRPLALSS